MTKEFKAFSTWCEQPNPMSKGKYSLPQVTAKDSPQIQDELIYQVNNLLTQTDEQPFDIELKERLKSNSNISIKRDKVSEEININRLSISTDNSGKPNVSLENLSINVLNIHSASSNKVPVTIEDCEIKELSLTSNASVCIKNSKIGILKVYNESAIRYLKVENGCILNIDCPTPGKENPLNGPILFKNVFLPKILMTTC